MDSSIAKTIGLAAVTAVITVFAARADSGATVREAAGVVAADTADSVVTPRWITDGNVVAIVGTMIARQRQVADVELSAWRSDTVRALATTIKTEQGALQYGLDSIAAALRIVPVPSALSEQVTTTFQAQVDSMADYVGGALDRAYLRQASSSLQQMAQYLDQLADAATEPALRSWLEVASARVGGEVSRLTTQQRAFVVADSIVADSLAKRSADRGARRTRQPNPE